MPRRHRYAAHHKLPLPPERPLERYRTNHQKHATRSLHHLLRLALIRTLLIITLLLAQISRRIRTHLPQALAIDVK